MLMLDTNVVSELRKRDRANPTVLAWADSTDPDQFYISAVTLLEVQYGALLIERRDAMQGRLMRAWISTEIIPNFAGRILPIDDVVALRCAGLHVPDRRPDRDAYIAATALVHGLTVVTRNTRDFLPMGVKLLNPWEAT